MKLAEFGIILTGVLLNAFAQLLLKAGANKLGHIEFSVSQASKLIVPVATNIPILGGLTCYVISVAVWIVALSRVDVSVAYPMLSIGYIVNAGLAWWLFGEVITLQRLIGIGIIIIGVLLVARS